MLLLPILLCSALAAEPKHPLVETPIVPPVGTVFTFAVTQQNAGGEAQHGEETVTILHVDEKSFVFDQRDSLHGNASFVRTYGRNDPVFVALHGEIKPDPSAPSVTVDASNVTDTAFPLYANTPFSTSYDVLTRNSSDGQKREQHAADSCKPGDLQKYQSPAGEFDVVIIHCDTDAGVMTIATDSYYAPSVGLSIRVETHIQAKNPGDAAELTMTRTAELKQIAH